MNKLGVVLVVIVAQFSIGLSYQSTAPAFLWSSHQESKKRDTELLYELQWSSTPWMAAAARKTPLHGSKKSLSCSVFSSRKLETHCELSYNMSIYILKAISPHSGKRGPKRHRGMCTSSVYWRSRFGRGMRTSVFSSHTFGRGMCTSVLPSHAAVRGTWQQTSVRGCSSILERSSPSCKDGIYSASCQMFRIMRSVFRR